MIRSQSPAPRGGAALAALASRLTDRDRRIALDCYEHRVLATEQVRRLHFRAERTARERLQELRELRVLASFRPAAHAGQGSAQNHWVLDEAGAIVVAAELGLERAELRWRAQAALAIASSSKLAHQLAVNEFFTRLVEEAREAGGELARWWGERRSRDLLDGIATPDGYGRLHLPSEPALELLLELDRGSEDHGRLKEKARRYAKALPRSELRDPLVLLLLPSHERAARAADGVAASAAPIVARTWTAASEGSVLALVRDAHERTRHHCELEPDW
ncbi:MAG: replication-relaxation family protein [Gaiellaceae bacterium]